jgi:hypothetical protein
MRRRALVLALASSAMACRSDLVVGSEAVDPGALRQGLVAMWKLDDGPGSPRAADSSGNGNDADPESVSASDWRGGYRDGGLGFGRAGWLRSAVTASLDSVTSQLSMVLWVRLERTFPEEEILIARQNGTSAATHFALRLRDGRPGLAGDDLSTCESPTTLPIGRWISLAAVFDGTEAWLAFDGREVVRCAATGSFPADVTAVTVGAALTGASATLVDRRFGVGTLDEVRLYNRALDLDEVRAVAAGQSP